MESHDGKPDTRLGNHDKVVIVGAGPAGVLSAMYLKKMIPEIDVKIIDSKSDDDMSFGGPRSCKGCVGGLVGGFLDELYKDFRIDIPDEIKANTIKGARFVNLGKHGQKRIDIDFDELEGIWDLPYHDTVFVSRGNGIPEYRKLSDKNVSFDYFMRQQARKMDIEIECGVIKEILVPDDAARKACVKYSTSSGDCVIDDISLVINSSGINNRNKIKLSSYSIKDGSLTLYENNKYRRVRGKKMGNFEFRIDQAYLEEYFGDRYNIYSGIKGANVIIAAPKILPEISWLTIAILPEDENADLSGICKEFLEKSGIQKIIEIGHAKPVCKCVPRFSGTVSERPYGNRYVEIGDVSGAVKYGRNGIGYAYHSAKEIIKVATYRGVSGNDFKSDYYKTYAKKIRKDNKIGKMVVDANNLVNKTPILAEVFYGYFGKSPEIKRFMTQILLGNSPKDNYTNGIKGLLKDTCFGLKIVYDGLFHGNAP